MSMNSLTAKKVRLAVKHNVSMTEFCDQNNVTMNECEDYILRTFKNGDARRIIKSLYRNIPSATTQRSAKPDADKPDESSSTLIPTATDATPNETALEILRKNERSYSEQAIDLENQYFTLFREYNGHQKALTDIQAKTRILKAELERHHQHVQEIIDAEKELLERMNELSLEHFAITLNLARIRDEISERSPVNAFVYDDGRIESENPDLELDDSGHEEIYRKMCDENPVAYENLRLRDLNTLAKVLAIVQNTTKRQIQFVFDNSELEKAYAGQPVVP